MFVSKRNAIKEEERDSPEMKTKEKTKETDTQRRVCANAYLSIYLLVYIVYTSQYVCVCKRSLFSHVLKGVETL